MPLDDILGLGKILPIDKLIDIVTNSVGRISKPYFDRKDVDTKAYEIEKLAEARAKEMKIISDAVKENFQQTGGIEYKEQKIAISSQKELQPIDFNNSSISERTQERLDFQEYKKQKNIESVTSFAAEELKNEPPIDNEPLDDDWTTRFFRIVEDISNEEMQTLWGKILAGEIKQPKTYSLRTLETIRNLSKKEANTFLKIANFVISTGNSCYLFKGKNEKLLSEKHKITYGEISLMVEAGLLQSGTFVNHQILKQAKDIQNVYTSGDTIIVVNVKANTPTIQIPVYVYSNSGKELLKLIKPNPPHDYLADFAKSIKSPNVEVKYGKILAWEKDYIIHTQPLLDF